MAEKQKESMENDKKDFLEFMTSHELPPSILNSVIKKDIFFTLNKGIILTKFMMLETLGALFSLSFCPQFGIGFNKGHGITHVLKMYGDVACAAFCGSLFLVTGTVLASMVMKEDELFWVWRRFRIPLIVLPASLWTLLMAFNIHLELDSETLSYHFIWISSAILSEEMILYIKNYFYKGELLKLKV